MKMTIPPRVKVYWSHYHVVPRETNSPYRLTVPHVTPDLVRLYCIPTVKYFLQHATHKKIQSINLKSACNCLCYRCRFCIHNEHSFFFWGGWGSYSILRLGQLSTLEKKVYIFEYPHEIIFNNDVTSHETKQKKIINSNSFE